MTRINVIDPKYLTDQHIMAEYRELPMVMGSLKRTLQSKRGWVIEKVSPHYTLNAGHVYFFTNKKLYLQRRFSALINELNLRGYNISPNDRTIDWSVFDNVPQIDWSPTIVDVTVNADRVRDRIALKPHWYKYYRRPLNDSAVYKHLTYPIKKWIME